MKDNKKELLISDFNKFRDSYIKNLNELLDLRNRHSYILRTWRRGLIQEKYDIELTTLINPYQMEVMSSAKTSLADKYK